jgi:hypothetical protein
MGSGKAVTASSLEEKREGWNSELAFGLCAIHSRGYLRVPIWVEFGLCGFLFRFWNL